MMNEESVPEMIEEEEGEDVVEDAFKAEERESPEESEGWQQVMSSFDLRIRLIAVCFS